MFFVFLAALVIIALIAANAIQDPSDNEGSGPTATIDTSTTGQGSFGEPHDRTDAVEVFYSNESVERSWIIEVLEPARDNTAEHSDDAGDLLATTRIRVRNQSQAVTTSLSEISFDAATGSGELIERSSNSCPSSFDDLDYSASVAPGTEIEGEVCWSIPEGSLGGLRLAIGSSEVDGRVYVLLR